MKVIYLLIAMTVSLSAYTKEEIRDMKYLRIEGIAAKNSADFYKEKLTKATDYYDKKVKEFKQAEIDLKSLKTRAKCFTLDCKHPREKACYKMRRSLLKQQAEVKKIEAQLPKLKKNIDINKRYTEGKEKLYLECLEKYKRIKDGKGK